MSNDPKRKTTTSDDKFEFRNKVKPIPWNKIMFMDLESLKEGNQVDTLLDMVDDMISYYISPKDEQENLKNLKKLFELCQLMLEYVIL